MPVDAVGGGADGAELGSGQHPYVEAIVSWEQAYVDAPIDETGW